MPGTYTVTLASLVDGTKAGLAGPVSFEVKPLDLATFPAADREAVQAFRLEAAELQRVVDGAGELASEVEIRLEHLRQAVLDTPDADPAALAGIEAIRTTLNALLVELNGDSSAAKRSHATAPSISGRISSVVGGQWYVTSAPTQTNSDLLQWASDAFTAWLPKLRTLIEDRLVPLEQQLEMAGAPWTPGRFPEWPRR